MIYLDNSATSRFKPSALYTAMMKELMNSSNPGRSGHKDSINCALKIFNTRDCIKKFLSADDDYDVIFTSNCTEALNLSIFGFAHAEKEPFEVITTQNEHNSVLRPLFLLKSIGKVKVNVLPVQKDGSISALQIKNALTPYTRLVVINHISNVTGAKTNVKEIGKIIKSYSPKIKYIVDTAQSLGHCHIDINECNIDMLCGAGHKGLHGPQGVGFLVLHKNTALKPIRYGGTGTNSESVSQPIVIPEAYESGTQNAPAIIGLAESINWTNEHFDEIETKIEKLSSELIYHLRKMPKIHLYSCYPSGVVSFNVSGLNSYEVSNYFDENDVAIRSGLHCAPLIHKQLGTISSGTARASLGFCNQSEDIENFLILLEKLIKQL